MLISRQAALFSAINTAFLSISLSSLRDNPSEETNTLLRLIAQGVSNTTLTSTNLKPPHYSPLPSDVRINQLFSTSLTFSLMASFGALLGQQWLIYYGRRKSESADAVRWEATRKLDGAERWRLRGALEILLPTLLQAALFIFMIGFIEFLYTFSNAVALPNLILTVAGAAVFVATIGASIWDPFCPFKTSLPILAASSLLRLAIWTQERARRTGIQSNGDRPLDVRYNIVRSVCSLLDSLRRPSKPEAFMSASRIRRIMEEERDLVSLCVHISNIPLIEEPSAAKSIWENDAAVNRLHHIASSPFGVVGGQELTSVVFSHLILERLGAQHAIPPSHTSDSILPIFEQAAEYLADQNYIPGLESLFFIPSSIATVAIISGFKRLRMMRHDNFLFRSIQTAHQASYALGMIAWVISSEYSEELTPKSGAMEVASRPRKERDVMKSIESAALVYRSLRQAKTVRH